MGIGLLANVQRIRATRILDMARSIGFILSPHSDKGLLKTAGLSDSQVARFEFEAWKAEGLRSAAEKIGSI